MLPMLREFENDNISLEMMVPEVEYLIVETYNDSTGVFIDIITRDFKDDSELNHSYNIRGIYFDPKKPLVDETKMIRRIGELIEVALVWRTSIIPDLFLNTLKQNNLSMHLKVVLVRYIYYNIVGERTCVY